MKVTITVVLCVVATAVALAQSASGVLSGVVKDPGGAVSGATVQAKNQATGRTYTAATGRTGAYRIPALPPGAYDVTVPALGFRTNPFEKKDVVVEGGKTNPLDIELRLGNQGVVGDDNAYLAIRGKHGEITGRTPRMPDGKPDLSGVWNASAPIFAEPPALLPWAADVMKERDANAHRDSPAGLCLPSDPVLSWPLLYRIVHTQSVLVELFEQEPHYRQVFLDGRSHPADADPTWMGHSIGRWEKDTLVVETVGLNDKSWITLEDLPHTEQLRITQRYRRPDRGHLLVEATLDDPRTFSRPVQLRSTWELVPGEEILESICTENNKYAENAGLK